MAEIAIAVAISAAISAASYTLNYILTPKPKPQERGRLQGQLQVQDSSYGSMIPIILGGDLGDGSPHGIRAAGNVHFLSEIRKEEKIVPATGGGGSHGGKGGGGGGGGQKERQITYYVDVGFILGEPGSASSELELMALYAGADLIYDTRGTAGGITGAIDPLLPPDPTGAIDPLYPPDPPYDPDLPPHPQDPIWRERPSLRYNHTPTANTRNEISTTLVSGGYAALRFYPGNETQEPDPLISADFQKTYASDFAAGRAVTPAYLGRAYVVLQNFNISKYGAVPNFTAIVRNKNLKTAAQILNALAVRSGVLTTELDLTGLASSKVRGMAIINRSSVKQISEDTLSRRFPFDWTQKNGQLKTVVRGGAILYDVPPEHLGFKDSTGGGGKESNATPDRVAVKLKLGEAELPRSINVKAFDPTKNFEVASAQAKRREVTSKIEKTLEVNMALSVDEMREIAQRELDTAWLEERQAIEISLPHTYASIVPTDVLRIFDGESPVEGIYTIRVKEITGSIPGALSIAGVPVDQTLYVSNAAPPASIVTGAVKIPATVIGTFINSGYLRDRDAYGGQFGYYAGCTSFGNGEFRGAQLYRDRGAGYEFVADFPVRATMGRAATLLTSSSTSIDVDLYGDAELESYSSDAVAGGSGWIFIGDEALQYTNAAPVAGYVNRWCLSGLTSRGGKDTQRAAGSHVANERFVLLNEALRFIAVEVSENGVARSHKFVPLGMAIDDASVVSFTFTVPVPPAPLNLTGARIGAGDLAINWEKGVRANKVVYPGEEPEKFILEILNGTAVVREHAITKGFSEPVRWTKNTTINSDSNRPAMIDFDRDGSIFLVSPSLYYQGIADSQPLLGDVLVEWQIDSRLSPNVMEMEYYPEVAYTPTVYAATSVVGGVPVIYAESNPDSRTRQAAGDLFAMRIANGHVFYYRNYSGEQSAPFWTGSYPLEPDRQFILRARLGFLNGENQAALRARVTFNGPLAFTYTHEMQMLDFPAGIPATVRVRVRQESSIGGAGDYAEIIA